MANDDGGRRRLNDSRFRWIVTASLLALALVLGTIQELLK